MSESGHVSFRARPVQCVLLGLSCVLLGMSFGDGVNPRMEPLALQAGLLGLIAFGGLAHQSSRTEAAERDGVATTSVERRLERMVVPPPHQMARAGQSRSTTSTKIRDRKGRNVRISID